MLKTENVIFFGKCNTLFQDSLLKRKFEEHNLFEIEILNVLIVKSDQLNKHTYRTGSRLLNDTMYVTIIGN